MQFKMQLNRVYNKECLCSPVVRGVSTYMHVSEFQVLVDSSVAYNRRFGCFTIA